MADPADAWRSIAFAARAIPGQLGLRPHSVKTVVGTWTGEYTGRGYGFRSAQAITEAGGFSPKVRWLSDEELAVGNLGKGVVEIGPITTGYPAGGTLLSQIQPALAAGETLHLIIQGPMHPDGAKYLITSVRGDHAIHWTIRAEPVSDVVP